MLRKKWLLGISLALLISITAACGSEGETAVNQNDTLNEEENVGEIGEGNQSADGDNSQAPVDEPAAQPAEGVEQPEMPEPDLEGIPEVVVEVNEEEITREEFISAYEGQFQLAVMQSQMMGQELDQDQLKVQIAESMVGTELLMQEAANRNYDASEESINQTLDELVAQNGMESKEEFLAALEQQGMDEENVMSELANQVKITALIEAEAGDLTPTDEELQQAYDQMTAQQQMGEDEAEMPSFDEMKPNLEEQIMMQKEQEVVMTLITELRENAEVTIHL